MSAQGTDPSYGRAKPPVRKPLLHSRNNLPRQSDTRLRFAVVGSEHCVWHSFHSKSGWMAEEVMWIIGDRETRTIVDLGACTKKAITDNLHGEALKGFNALLASMTLNESRPARHLEAMAFLASRVR